MINHTGINIVKGNPFEGDFKLYILGYNNLGEVEALAAQIIMDKYEPGHAANENGSVTFSEEDAVKIMNTLWMAGIRPHGYKGAVGQVQAMKEHIDDLRVVAKIIKPRMPEPGV